MPKTLIKPITSKIYIHQISMGCDPEFFIEKNGEIIGSEKIIDIEKGLQAGNSNSKLIVDGVQVELNPSPSTCRQILASEISNCFRKLQETISTDKELRLNFQTTIKITKKELESLNEKSRIFGCAPSINKDQSILNKIKLKDPSKYRIRSAGGHIHIAATDQGDYNPINIIIKKVPERLIDIMDIIVGNTCVLLDRDPGNKERRKVYGKAGEYRTPPHGIEYRTLSNFWLKSYPLMSLVMSLSRLSVSLLANSMPGRNYEEELLDLVNLKKIKKAINNNDFELAMDNYQKIKPFLERISPINTNLPITTQNSKEFEFFIKKGIDYWFKEDPMTNWTKEGFRDYGWEAFVTSKVRTEMLKELKQ